MSKPYVLVQANYSNYYQDGDPIDLDASPMDAADLLKLAIAENGIHNVINEVMKTPEAKLWLEKAGYLTEAQAVKIGGKVKLGSSVYVYDGFHLSKFVGQKIPSSDLYRMARLDHRFFVPVDDDVIKVLPSDVVSSLEKAKTKFVEQKAAKAAKKKSKEEVRLAKARKILQAAGELPAT